MEDPRLSINLNSERSSRRNHPDTSVVDLQEGAEVSSVIHRVLTVDKLLWSEFKTQHLQSINNNNNKCDLINETKKTHYYE